MIFGKCLIDSLCQFLLPFFGGQVNLFVGVGDEPHLGEHAGHIGVLADVELALLDAAAGIAPVGHILTLDEEGEEFALACLRTRQWDIRSIE